MRKLLRIIELKREKPGAREGEKAFHSNTPEQATGARLAPVCLNRLGYYSPPLAAGQLIQAVVLTRDLISHSSMASLSSTSSQPQIMARVWAVMLWPVVIM
jgi:hypothetical protein